VFHVIPILELGTKEHTAVSTGSSSSEEKIPDPELCILHCAAEFEMFFFRVVFRLITATNVNSPFKIFPDPTYVRMALSLKWRLVESESLVFIIHTSNRFHA
jgi:hypothetical protein